MILCFTMYFEQSRIFIFVIQQLFFMNQQEVDQLAERIINETNSAISCLTLYLGHKLDLFNSLKEEGPVTSSELATKTNYSERYLREWLECMTVNGYIQ